MKCAHCGCEWTLASGTSAPTKCPFCGEPLTQKAAPPKLNTMEDALKYIAGTYGDDILHDGQRLIAYFADIAPQMHREYKLLRDFLQCKGNTRLIDVMPLPYAEQRQEWVRLTQYMEKDMWINSNAVSLVCESFWNAASSGKIPAPVLTQTPEQIPTININQPDKAQSHTPAKPASSQIMGRIKNAVSLVCGSFRNAAGGVKASAINQHGKTQSQTPAKPTPHSKAGVITIAGKTIRTDVTELDLSRCYSLTDLSPLSSLLNLTTLKLSDCSSLTDLSPLSSLSQLTSLKLESSKKLADLSPLSSLSNLKALSLSDCYRLTDISPLSRLSNLTELNLNGCDLTDLSPLSSLSNLTGLELSELENIIDLRPLSSLSQLITLDLHKCILLDELDPLSSLSNLTTLNLRECLSVYDIGPLSCLSQLTTLDLGSCISLIDLSPLSSLSNLTTLMLDRCYLISDEEVYKLRKALPKRNKCKIIRNE